MVTYLIAHIGTPVELDPFLLRYVSFEGAMITYLCVKLVIWSQIFKHSRSQTIPIFSKSGIQVDTIYGHVDM